MREPKYTKGPWVIDTFTVSNKVCIRPQQSTDGFASIETAFIDRPGKFAPIAEVAYHEDFTAPNAYLMSAAPEMYEVLRAFEIQLSVTNRLDDITVDVIKDMILALRKAEGAI